MRGKKVDNEFVSDFITNCIKSGIDTPESILAAAQTEINEIDKLIRKVEDKKKRRAKLLDVASSFEKPKVDKSEAKVLSFFKIENPHICYFICQSLKKGPFNLNEVKSEYQMLDIIFCVKQLIEHKIVSKSGPFLLRASEFESYMKFALKEEV